LLKASAPSTMNGRQTSGIEPAPDEIVDQRLHYGGVQLGCPPPLRNALSFVSPNFQPPAVLRAMGD
jgi:hypothetical protein